MATVLAGLNLLVIAPDGTAPQTAPAGSARFRLLVVNVEYGNDEYDRVARLIGQTEPGRRRASRCWTAAWARTSARTTSRSSSSSA